MSLLSCANCWYNPLQYDLIGDEIGYCVEHRKVLRRPDVTTCGRLLRKDLGWSRAVAVSQRHQDHFSRDEIVALHGRKRTHLPILTETDTAALAGDQVREEVCDYGRLETTISSLQRLETIKDARGEVAFLSLSRSYVNRCVQRRGRWTSGLHLVWKLGQRLGTPPRLDVRDLRRSAQYAGPAERLERLLELATWSLSVLRLSLLDDVVGHEARDTPSGERILAPLHDLLERAAGETQEPSAKKLQRWIDRVAIPAFHQALPRARYEDLAAQLHRGPDQDTA